MNENPPSTVDPPAIADATAAVPGLVRRYAVLTMVLTLGVVLVGFLRGVKEPPPVTRRGGPAPLVTMDAIPPAVRYGELPTHPLRPREGTSLLSGLKYD